MGRSKYKKKEKCRVNFSGVCLSEFSAFSLKKKYTVKEVKVNLVSFFFDSALKVKLSHFSVTEFNLYFLEFGIEKVFRV